VARPWGGGTGQQICRLGDSSQVHSLRKRKKEKKTIVTSEKKEKNSEIQLFFEGGKEKGECWKWIQRGNSSYSSDSNIEIFGPGKRNFFGQGKRVQAVDAAG